MVEVDDMDALKDTKYVVFARAVGKNSDGETILRYMLAPHPFGDVPKQKDNILTVEGSQITKVHVEGYVDKKDDQFLEELFVSIGQIISKASNNSATPPPPQEDEESKKAAQLAKEKTEKEEAERLEQERERLRRDPFYKFRKKVEE